MNQEQNNFNVNNFNTEGNNEIPNNQPLNNQNLTQNTIINQSTFNIHPEVVSISSTHDFQQDVNTFENSSANEQNFNNKLKNNKKIYFIVGTIFIIIIILIIALLIVFNNKKENDINNNAINGNLVYEEDSVMLFSIGENYFAIEDGNGTDGMYTYIIDCEGNVVANTEEEYAHFNYISDNYFLKNYDNSVISNNQNLLQIYGNGYSYKDNIIYYTKEVNGQNFLYAYDLRNKKKKWNINGKLPIILHNDIIVSKFGDDDKIQLVSKEGNVVVKEIENEKIYPTSVDRYIKLVNNSIVEVYDLNNKLLSSLELESSDTLEDVLSIGFFIVKHNVNDTYEYRIYNDQSKLIKTFNFEYYVLNYPYPEKYFGLMAGIDSLDDNKKSIIISNSSTETIILLSNGAILDNISTLITHDGYIVDWAGVLDYSKASFGITQNQKNECLLINLDTLKNLVVDEGFCDVMTGNNIIESSNGKYVILSDLNKSKRKYYVYDQNLNLIFQSNAVEMRSFDDDNVIEVYFDSMYLVNVFTNKKVKLNLKGHYAENNTCGIVTYDKTSHYVYKIK